MLQKNLVLHNIQYFIPVKLVILMEMCLNETYSTVRVQKHLCDMLHIENILKQEAALVTLFLNFSLL